MRVGVLQLRRSGKIPPAEVVSYYWSWLGGYGRRVCVKRLAFLELDLHSIGAEFGRLMKQAAGA